MTTFERPTGSPAALRATAGRQDRAATTIDAVIEQARGSMTGLQEAWEGEASAAAQVSLRGLVTMLEDARSAVAGVGGHLRTYADVLERAQNATDTLQNDYDTVTASYRQQVREYPDDWQSLLWQYDAAVAELRGIHRSHTDAVDDAARTLLRAVEAELPSFIRDHAQGTSDWFQEMATSWMRSVPVLRSFEPYLGLGMEVLPAAGAGVYGLFQIPRLRRYFTGESALTARWRPLGYLGDQHLLGRIPGYTSFMTGQGGRLSAFLMGTDQSANLLKVFGNASSGSRWATTLSTAGALRTLGVAGSIVGTGVSLVNVVSQGNPIEAFQHNGTEYLADIAELGFNASLTAALIAPNPVTVGAAVVTGVAYAGLEIWNHREEIGQAIGDGIEAIGNLADDVTDAVGRVVEDPVGAAKDAISWLNPFD